MREKRVEDGVKSLKNDKYVFSDNLTQTLRSDNERKARRKK